MLQPIVCAHELRSEGIDPKTIFRTVAVSDLIRKYPYQESNYVFMDLTISRNL